MLCLVAQSCWTLCNAMDCSRLGSSVHEDSSRQEYLSGLPCPPPGNLLNPGIKPRSPTFQVDSLPSEPPGNMPIRRASIHCKHSGTKDAKTATLSNIASCLTEGREANRACTGSLSFYLSLSLVVISTHIIHWSKSFSHT